MAMPTSFPLASKAKITSLPLSLREVNEDQIQMLKKRKEEKAQKKVQGHGKEAKKSMISLNGVKKVMLAQKPIFLAYPSESSPSFQSPHSRCPQDLSLVLDEFKDVFQEPPKGLPPLRGIEHQIDFIQGLSLPNRLAYRTSNEGLTPTKDGGTCLRRLSMFRKEVH